MLMVDRLKILLLKMHEYWPLNVMQTIHAVISHPEKFRMEYMNYEKKDLSHWQSYLISLYL